VTYYKVLSDGLTSRNGGTYQWVLGEWAPEIEGELVPCHNGYHVCQESDLLEWLGPVICECEIGPESVRARDKTVARTARIVRVLETWNERTARLFACDCAERVLPLFGSRRPDDSRPRAAIAIARSFANGEATRDELVAARAAAWYAAWYAAWDAEGSVVAWSAAGAAAGAAAAWSAVWAAAGAASDAAWDAARAAASAAERQWQAQRLMEYLRGEAL
jgi:hypothetical protein